MAKTEKVLSECFRCRNDTFASSKRRRPGEPRNNGERREKESIFRRETGGGEGLVEYPLKLHRQKKKWEFRVAQNGTKLGEDDSTSK
ncbi:hypothetical protein M569_16355 [Genlisea aurea]|uniref:Uncharacterized protein n=1 Tax=Genlisea aurea TaxID=192259 RepID=S8C217_9LAMI|nr:hypothetical protein M569_16355 [Genlisea aurea]